MDDAENIFHEYEMNFRFVLGALSKKGMKIKSLKMTYFIGNAWVIVYKKKKRDVIIQNNMCVL